MTWRIMQYAVLKEATSHWAKIDSDTSQKYRMRLYCTCKAEDGKWRWMAELYYETDQGRRSGMTLATRKGQEDLEYDAKHECAKAAQAIVASLGIQVTELVTNGADR